MLGSLYCLEFFYPEAFQFFFHVQERSGRERELWAGASLKSWDMCSFARDKDARIVCSGRKIK